MLNLIASFASDRYLSVFVVALYSACFVFVKVRVPETRILGLSYQIPFVRFEHLHELHNHHVKMMMESFLVDAQRKKRGCGSSTRDFIVETSLSTKPPFFASSSCPYTQST